MEVEERRQEARKKIGVTEKELMATFRTHYHAGFIFVFFTLTSFLFLL